MKNTLLGLSIALLATSTLTGLAAPAPKIQPEFGKVAEQCAKPSEGVIKPHVWLFKQWHLAPAVNTRRATPGASQPIPQEKNQTAIFRQLDAWVKEKSVRDIFAEGCSGELTQSSKVSFNGWNIPDLRKLANQPDYPAIVSSVPLKIEAKHGDAVKTRCGDNESLIQEHALAFSDARGVLGFLTRLEQHKSDPARAKTYLDGVISLYKLPSSATVDQATTRLKEELKKSVVRIRSATEKRNEILVDRIKALSGASHIAVVFGGLHASGIKELLEKSGFGCSVIEPVGYQDNESGLMKQLEEAVNGL